MNGADNKALRLPLLLKGKAQTRIWGGYRLGEKDGARVGELWSLSVRDKEEENCTVDGGCFDGMTLKSLIEETDGEIVGGTYRKGDRFPLLIKLLDTSDILSLQVHPVKEYADLHGGDAKTEMWYVLDCEKDARFLYGMKSGETADSLKEALTRGECASLMQTSAAEVGKVLFVPAGMPHAIGGGIFLAEIQENSDTTYRLDDYGRRDAKGNLRDLHVEDGLAVTRPFTEEEIIAHRYGASMQTPSADMLACTDLFCVRVIDGECVTVGDCFRALIALQDLRVTNESGDTLDVRAYETCFLPANAGTLQITGRALLVFVPLLEKGYRA